MHVCWSLYAPRIEYVCASALFVNSDKAGVSAACSALAMLRYTLNTQTGNNQPFPLPQHDSVCECVSVWVCQCVAGAPLRMRQMGPRTSCSHGGGGKSLLDVITFTPTRVFLDRSSLLLNLLKIRSSALAACGGGGCLHAKRGSSGGQSKPSLTPKPVQSD